MNWTLEVSPSLLQRLWAMIGSLFWCAVGQYVTSVLFSLFLLGHSLFFLYSVWLGSVDVNHSSKGKEYYVSKIITYPSHYGITRDIALLKLLSMVTFTALILPICLPSISKQLLTLPALCWVTGWGQTQEGTGEMGRERDELLNN